MKGLLLSLATLIVFASNTEISASVQKENEAKCARSRAAATFRNVVAANNGTVEVFHIQGGIVALITADNPKATTAIQAAARDFMEQSKMALKSQVATASDTEPCLKIEEGLRLKTISEQSEPFSRGVLLAITSRDPKLADVIVQSGCCDYCICPSTVTHCARCC